MSPTSKWDEKKEDINLLFIHTTHLINEFHYYQSNFKANVGGSERKRIETTGREISRNNPEKVMEMLQQTVANLPDSVDMEH
ncbi:hypothetical protein AVEN_240078-1 [Araneus ventricosus]|uniref:Uncharacterized protein n=1 Tax=Araneus ventricosus TaxID=182803 RepID=A0A4Y2KQA8_ARAVE|nr:hypothetical protein AVEN_240078-1 [Araneus ventricosus]